MILTHQPTANAHDTTTKHLLRGQVVIVVVKLSSDDTSGQRNRHGALSLFMFGGMATNNIESSPPTHERAPAA